METVVEEGPDELKNIDEFFSWDEDEDEWFNEFEESSTQQQPNEMLDYASDIRFNLTQLLSHMQMREPRYPTTLALLHTSVPAVHTGTGDPCQMAFHSVQRPTLVRCTSVTDGQTYGTLRTTQ